MPMKSEATVNDVARFDSFHMLKKHVEEIIKRMKRGEKLLLVESSFSDPGEDYSALEFEGGERVGYWPGY